MNCSLINHLSSGCWKLAKETAEDLIYDAIVKCGVRHLDCASDYGNEVEVGRGIKRAIDEGHVTREDLWVTSKLWNTYHHPEHVKLACERTLQDLQLTYVDLYSIHFPISLKFVPFEARYPPEWIHDPSAANPRIELDFVPMASTWKAMDVLVGAGLCRHIGVCNVNVQLLMDLLGSAVIKPYANQVT